MNKKLQKKLNGVNWKAFIIGELFIVDKGKYLPQKYIKKGKTPYITANTNKNGITRFIGNEPLFEGNAITIEKINFKSYYQPYPFYCSHDVTVLKHEKMNKYNGTFIANMINRQGKKYSYGKQAQLNVTKRESIFLPIDNNGNPNWEFMEQFMKEVEKEVKPKIHINKHDITEQRSLEDVEWREFTIEELFEIKIGKNLDGNKINKENGYYPYITRKETNNGLDGFVNWNDDSYLNKIDSPVITIGNETAKPFIQEHDFYTGTKVNIMKPYYPSNKYHLMFICTSLEKNREKYSYSYTINSTRLKKQKILLPAKSNKPDWGFMEQYMKKIENELLQNRLLKIS